MRGQVPFKRTKTHSYVLGVRMRYEDFEGEAADLIQMKLDEIELSEGVRILRAIESGSRAWGFASPDSDYDVRFIYVRPLRDYLTLRPKRKDTIEWVVDETLDICGWDLSKALQLAHKGNLFLFEWATSPVVYRSTETWDELWEVVRAYFSPRAALYSYYGIAHNTNRDFLQGECVRYKKYLYALRPLLACKFIAERREQPPVAFDELVDAAAPAGLRPAIDELLAAKSQMNERDEAVRIPAIDAFIDDALMRYAKPPADWPEEETRSWEPLEELFCKVVGAPEK